MVKNAVPETKNTLYFPVFEVTWPLTIEAIIIPATIGSINRPASVGFAPFTICSTSGRVIIPPNIPTPTITPTMVTIVKVLDLKSLSGKIASSPAARSARMNHTIPMAPVRYMPIERALVQPHSRPFSATKRSGTTASTMVVAPHQSMRWLTGVCGTCKKRQTR